MGTHNLFPRLFLVHGVTFDEMSFETLVEVFAQSGIDLDRVYVSGGTALHSYLRTLGRLPEWAPGDVDLFIEIGALSVDEDMKKLLDVLARSFDCARLSMTRVRANVPVEKNADFIFSRHPNFTVAEWVGSFDISVCKVYFRLATWKNPEYLFADTARNDIDRRIMRVAPVLLEPFGVKNTDHQMQVHFCKKLGRVSKYRNRGFCAEPDPDYSRTMDLDLNRDWESSGDNIIVAMIAAEQREKK